jgi:hypothetical protein
VRRLVRALDALSILALWLVLNVTNASAQVEPRPARKGRKYTVKIDSSPQQAAIYLDDKKYGIVGYTPYTGKLVQGDYKLILELPGFKTIERQLRVDSKNKEFFLPMEKQELPGTLDVQATADPNVAGATVLVDGLSVGTAPTLYDVKEGRHQLQIKKDGFEEYTQWVDLKQGQRVTLTPVLKATVKANPKGSLLVDADVADGEVYVDGQKQADTTPTLIDGLEEGPHIVEVRKPPATPWKQTVYVKSGQRSKVTAELASTLTTAKKGGTVRIVASVPGAEVWVDGKLAGTAPYDATDLPAGDHLIEVRAKGYANKEQRVTVNVGTSDIIKFDLVAAGAGGGATSKIKIVSPVPEARAFIDGANVGTAPIDKDVTAGEHYIVVEKEGYAKFEQKVSIEAGQTLTVTAVLRSVGKVRFLSTPGGAEIVLDGKVMGKTPFETDVEGGAHVVTLRLEGYYDFEDQNLQVAGGQTVNVSAPLRLIDSGPTAEEVSRRKATLSSFSARTMPFGDFTVDVSLGYPYWIEGQATVGGSDAKELGWDVSLGFRSLVTTWEFLGTGRLRLFERDPFSFAAFGTIGGGGGFDGRNQFTLQAGVLNTVTFRSGYNAVTVTGRAYFDIWSDRLCGLDTDGKLLDGAPSVCSTTDTTLLAKIKKDYDISADERLERYNGVRFFISLVVEAAVTEQMNFFFILEGAPFQGQRATHSDIFNSTMLGSDPIYNGRAGITFKF